MRETIKQIRLFSFYTKNLQANVATYIHNAQMSNIKLLFISKRYLFGF